VSLALCHYLFIVDGHRILCLSIILYEYSLAVDLSLARGSKDLMMTNFLKFVQYIKLLKMLSMLSCYHILLCHCKCKGNKQQREVFYCCLWCCTLSGCDIWTAPTMQLQCCAGT